MQIYSLEKDCCGCGACTNICPTGAITMEYDQYGCAYPVIDANKCIHCEACKRVCPMLHAQNKCEPTVAYAAAEQSDIILNSSSGGVFAALGRSVIENEGAVFGCAWVSNEGILKPEIIMAHTAEQLKKLQGSKYVQANAGECYRLIREEVRTGRTVLFSGTPCQIGALRNFIGTNAPNLYCIDIICHGVPGTKFFLDYLKWYEEKHRVIVKDISFRDKLTGWGLNGSITVCRKEKEQKSILYEKESSYFHYFLKCITYRESCYHCPYANQNRSGDITIGDFWGIEEEHPDLIRNSSVDLQRGISCVLVNTPKGKELLDRFGQTINLFKSEPQKVISHNQQLRHPSEKPLQSETVLKQYREKGYQGVEDCFTSEKDLKWRLNYLKRRIKRIVKQ